MTAELSSRCRVTPQILYSCLPSVPTPHHSMNLSQMPEQLSDYHSESVPHRFTFDIVEKYIMASTHHCSIMHGDVTALTILWSPTFSSLPLKNINQVRSCNHSTLEGVGRQLHSRTLLTNSVDSIETFCFSQITSGLNDRLGVGGQTEYVMSSLLPFVRQCLLKSGCQM